MAPTGVPTGGNGKYIAVAVVLLLGIIGLLIWKFKGGEQPVATVPSVPSVPPPPPTNPRLDDVPLIPVTPDAGPEAGPKPTGTAVATNPCDVKKCTGATTSELEQMLAMRAKQARVCYEKALQADSTLQGHVKIGVKIAGNGQVCDAHVASNDMGSAYVGQCVANKFRQTGGFPAPKGGCVEVEVPLSFVPGK
jgi:hypothetical protein